MANFAFNTTEGQRVNLTLVDEEICADLEIECHPSRFCFEYDMLVSLGMAVLMDQGGCKVTPEGLGKYLARLDDPIPADSDAHKLASKFLAGGRYTFEAWR